MSPPAFEHGGGEFCPHTARLMARLSRFAYGDEHGIMPAGRDPTWIMAGNTECVVAEYPTFVVVAFRGTEANFGDILTDIKIRKRDLRRRGFFNADGCAHEGFTAALDDVWYHVSDRLDGIGKPVYMTGHSLGGALAILAEKRTKCVAVYTFGAPRVGDLMFVKYSMSGAPHHRIVNQADIVPWLPLMVMGYRHSGTLHYIDRVGGLVENPGLPQVLRTVAGRLVGASLKERWERGFPLVAFTDHRIGRYIENLEAAA